MVLKILFFGFFSIALYGQFLGELGGLDGLLAKQQTMAEIRIADLLAGLTAVLQWEVLGFLAIGVVLGAIFGSLPGLTATMGVAVLTPLTFWVSAEQGLAMLLGIYCGAIPAGGIPAILINVPGTPASGAWKLLNVTS